MIKFFRKIRQNLVSENKFSKYLIYAIGEIILVVIGILIALQINNWNEGQKEKKLEYDIIQQLGKDLEEDLVNMQSFIEYQELTSESQKILIEWIQSDRSYSDSIAPHIMSSYAYTEFTPRKVQYESLKQIGMRKISNETLRNQISDLYENKSPEYSIVERLYLKETQKLADKSIDHFKEFTWKARVEIIDIQKYKSDHRYLYQLKLIKNLGDELLNRMISNKKEFEKTLAMVQGELSTF